MTNYPLAGKGVLITRPKLQAQSLAEKISQLGGNPVVYPTLEISPIQDKHLLLDAVNRLYEFDIIIFTSVNAVINSAPLIKRVWQNLPQHLQIAAIGDATKQELQNFGFTVTISPTSKFNSEELLALKNFSHLNQKRVAIFTGKNGRPLLKDTLEQRGAIVHKIDVYQRSCPLINSDELEKYWQNQKIHIVLSTSNESLQNLVSSLNNQGLKFLNNTPLMVISSRMAEFAYSLGYRLTPIITENANERAIIKTLISWSQGEIDVRPIE